MTTYTFVRNIYGAIHTPTNPLKNRYYVDPSSTQTIIHKSNSNPETQPNNPYFQSSFQVNVIPSIYQLDFENHCLAYARSAPEKIGPNSEYLNDLQEYIEELGANNSEGENNFEIQSTYSTKLSVFLSDTLPSSIDSAIAILTNNASNMEDADIQLIFANLKKKDFATALALTNSLGSNRAEWKAYLLELNSIESDSLRGFSVQNDTSLVSFLQQQASVEGGDAQASAQSLLKLNFNETHLFPLVFPLENGSSSRGATGEENNQNLSSMNTSTSIFPNPFNNSLTVKNIDKGNGTLEIIIVDLLGRRIYSNFIDKGTEKHLSLKEFENGMYLVTIIDQNKTIILQEKVVKQ